MCHTTYCLWDSVYFISQQHVSPELFIQELRLHEKCHTDKIQLNNFSVNSGQPEVHDRELYNYAESVWAVVTIKDIVSVQWDLLQSQNVKLLQFWKNIFLCLIFSIWNPSFLWMVWFCWLYWPETCTVPWGGLQLSVKRMGWELAPLGLRPGSSATEQPVCVGHVLLPRVKEFKYVSVVHDWQPDGMKAWQAGWFWVSCVVAVLANWQLSLKVKCKIYQSVF